jgi:predicted GNAT family acetyltransferase
MFSVEQGLATSQERKADMDSRIIIRNCTDSGSYDASIGDHVVGTIVYEQRDGRVVLRHTVVDPEFRGQGIASALARFALDDLAASGKTLTNYCGFIADYIDRHPGYARLVDASRPGRAHPRDAALRAAESRP